MKSGCAHIATLGFCGLLGCSGLLVTDDAGPDAAADAGVTDAVTNDVGCAPATQQCGTSCTDLSSDLQNCGTCAHACPGADAGNTVAVCNAGKCDVECLGGTGKCGQKCVDEKSDPQNCGACGTICSGGCNEGSCCTAGLIACNGKCTDSSSDDSNCGSCGTACDAGVCAVSSCHYGQYDVGYDKTFSTTSLSPAGAMYGLPITITKPATLLAFGEIMQTSSGHVVMALYTDKAGIPDQLVASTPETAMVIGNQQIASPTLSALTAGQYWIMAKYEKDCSIFTDTVVSTSFATFPSNIAAQLPMTAPVTSTSGAAPFNCYIVVQ